MYGELGEKEAFMHFVDTLFQPISSDNVKYVQDKYSAICHFTSTESIESINELLQYVLDDHITTFFLMEQPHKMGMKIDDHLFNHLMDLNTPTHYKDLEYFVDDTDEEFAEWNRNEIENLGFTDEFPPSIDEDESVNDVRKIVQNYKQPLDMNMILDKISLSGVESLTQEEKKYLKNLSS